MPEWEYKTYVSLGDPQPETVAGLDALGKEGWELVSVSAGVAYLKRQALVLPKPGPEPVETVVRHVCGGCVNFSRVGIMNKRTGKMPGFCQAYGFSATAQDDAEKCEKFLSTSSCVADGKAKG